MIDTNLEFYRLMKLEKFKQFAELLGLDTGADLEIIYPLIQKSNSVVELGTGYGRVVDTLFRKGYKGQITAVERVPEYVGFLENTFADQIASGHLSISQQDIRQLSIELQADTILWLWSGILEQTDEEQEVSLSHCYQLLKPGGLMFIEAPYQKVHKVGEVADAKNITLKTEWGELHAYFTYPEDIKRLSEKCGFSSWELLVYKTATNLERAIYKLTK